MRPVSALGCFSGLLALGLAPLASQDEVLLLREAYQIQRQVEVERPFESGLLELREKYALALDRELEKASQAGDLDTAVALKREREAAGLAGAVAEANPSAAVLVRLRQAYQVEAGKLEEHRRASLAALVKRQVQGLKEKEVELTKAQRIDDALAVRHFRVELEGAVASPAGAGRKPSNADGGERPWVQMFNGKDLTGWNPMHTSRSFRVQEGVLEVRKATEKPDYLFWEGTKELPVYLKNFEVSATVRADPVANSGIYFHTIGIADLRSGNPVTGLEVALSNGAGPSYKFPTGSIHGVTEMRPLALDESQWFDLRFRVEGGTVTVWVNDREVTRHTQPGGDDPEGKGLRPEGGRLAIQANSQGGAYYFKNIAARLLPN